MAEWYFGRGTKQAGPVSAQRLKELAFIGELSPNDIVWSAGMQEWAKASNIPGLFEENINKLSTEVEWVSSLKVAAANLFEKRRELKQQPTDSVQAAKNAAAMAGSAASCAFKKISKWWTDSEAKSRDDHVISRMVGLWQPISAEGPSLRFTNEGMMLRSDGFCARYQLNPSERIVSILPIEAEKVILNIANLTEAELALSQKDAVVQYVRGTSHTDIARQKRDEAAKAALMQVGKVAGVTAIVGLGVLGIVAAAATTASRCPICCSLGSIAGVPGWCRSCGVYIR